MRTPGRALPLLLALLAGGSAAEETGSRSALAGNASAGARDFRHGPAAAVYRSDDFIRKRNRTAGPAVRGQAAWITGELDAADRFLRMHALVVRDEDVPDCGVAAPKAT